MGDLLQSASAWLAGQRKSFLASQAVYARDGSQVELAATVGQTRFQATDEQGLVTEFQARDFIIERADLVLGGVVVEPRRGDTITWNGKVFEVMAPPGEPVWRYSDPFMVSVRVHTKQVGGAT